CAREVCRLYQTGHAWTPCPVLESDDASPAAPSFDKYALDTAYRGEGVGVFDVDNDGNPAHGRHGLRGRRPVHRHGSQRRREAGYHRAEQARAILLSAALTEERARPKAGRTNIPRWL